MRFGTCLALLSLFAGCGGGASADGGIDAFTLVPGPDGQLGVCCPRDDYPSCDCTELGGWAPSQDECGSALCDGYGYVGDVDEWGCPIWREEWPPTGCCLCPPPDASVPDATVPDAAVPDGAVPTVVDAATP